MSFKTSSWALRLLPVGLLLRAEGLLESVFGFLV